MKPNVLFSAAPKIGPVLPSLTLTPPPVARLAGCTANTGLNPLPRRRPINRSALGTLKPGLCNFSVHMPLAARQVWGRFTTLLGFKSDSKHALVALCERTERKHPAAGRQMRQLIIATFGEKVFATEHAHAVRESRNEFVEAI